MDVEKPLLRGFVAAVGLLFAVITTLYLAIILAPDLDPATADCANYTRSIWAGALAIAVIAGAIGLTARLPRASAYRPWIFIVIAGQVLASTLLLRAGLLDSSGPSSPAFHNQACLSHQQLEQWLPPLG
jgi:hypothetical protein